MSPYYILCLVSGLITYAPQLSTSAVREAFLGMDKRRRRLIIPEQIGPKENPKYEDLEVLTSIIMEAKYPVLIAINPLHVEGAFKHLTRALDVRSPRTPVVFVTAKEFLGRMELGIAMACASTLKSNFYICHNGEEPKFVFGTLYDWMMTDEFMTIDVSGDPEREEGFRLAAETEGGMPVSAGRRRTSDPSTGETNPGPTA